MQFTPIDIPFGAGLNEHLDDKSLSPPNVREMVNCVYSRDGSVEKRKGHEALGRSTTSPGTSLFGTLTSGACLTSTSDELLLIDGDALYARSDAKSAWRKRDAVPTATLRRERIARSPTSLSHPDVGQFGDYIVTAWVRQGAGLATTGTVYLSVYDAATRTWLLRDVVVSSAPDNDHDPRIVVTTTNVYVVYGRLVSAATSGRIYGRKVDLSSMALGFETLLVTDALQAGSALPCVFDAVPLTGADAYHIVYGRDAAIPDLRVLTYGQFDLPPIASTAVADSVGMCIGAISATSESLFVSYYNGTAIRCVVLSPSTLSVSAGPFSVAALAAASLAGMHVSMCRMSATQAMLVWFDPDHAALAHARITSAGAVSTIHRVPYLTAASRPWVHQGRVYILGEYVFGGDSLSLSAQARYIVLDLGPASTVSVSYGAVRAVALGTPGLGGQQLLQPTVPHVIALSDGSYLTLATVRDGSDTFFTRLGIDELRVRFDDLSRWTYARAGDGLALSGGVPSSYDGSLVTEFSPIWYPEYVSATDGAGGGSMADGTYFYKFVFERRDAKGQLQRSAPSPAASVVVSSSNANSVDLTVGYLSLTAAQDIDNSGSSPWSVIPYRTLVNGTVYYRLIPENTPATFQNSISSSAGITYTDTAADDDIKTHPILYTEGGVLESICPPSARYVAAWRGRLFLACTDDPKVLWYSRRIVLGEAPSFHDALTLRLADGDDITGIAATATWLVIFKRDRIYRLQGDGPNDLGQDDQFIGPDLLSSDVGCINARSIVVTREGVWFQSAKGLALLSQSGEVALVGSSIVSTLETYPTITSACLLEDDELVVWSCTDGTHGVQLVFDQRPKAWFLWSYHGPGGSDERVVSSCVHGGTYHWLASDGSTYKQSSSTWKDDGAYVSQRITSGWLTGTGKQGWQRMRDVLVLCDTLDSHELSVTLSHDYKTVAQQTETWDSAGIAALDDEQVRVHAERQKCSSVCVTVSDADDGSTTGRGFRLTSIEARVGVRSTTKRALPADAKA